MENKLEAVFYSELCGALSFVDRCTTKALSVLRL